MPQAQCVASGYNQAKQITGKAARSTGRKAGNIMGKKIEKDIRERESKLTEDLLQKRANARATCLQSLISALNNKKLSPTQQKYLLREITKRLGNPEHFKGNKLNTYEIVNRVKEGVFTSDDLKEITELINDPNQLKQEIYTVPGPPPTPPSKWFGYTKYIFNKDTFKGIFGLAALGMYVMQQTQMRRF